MSDKPILFSAPMVRALLEGRKTQTRRVLLGAWQAALEGHDHVKTWFSPPDVPREGIPNQWAQSGIWAEKHGPRGYNRFLGYAPCRPGDRLWVREAWCLPDAYVSDPALRKTAVEIVNYRATPWAVPGRWRSPIHMPRWASRLTLIVTDVRVERLQDVSRGDAMLEGCPFPNMAAGPNPRDWFRDVWDSINGAGAWEANPWVAAYSFEVHRCNIDAMP